MNGRNSEFRRVCKLVSSQRLWPARVQAAGLFGIFGLVSRVSVQKNRAGQAGGWSPGIPEYGRIRLPGRYFCRRFPCPTAVHVRRNRHPSSCQNSISSSSFSQHRNTSFPPIMAGKSSNPRSISLTWISRRWNSSNTRFQVGEGSDPPVHHSPPRSAPEDINPPSRPSNFCKSARQSSDPLQPLPG